MKSKCHRSMWLITPSRLTNVEFTILRMARKLRRDRIGVLNENDNYRSRDDGGSSGEEIDQWPLWLATWAGVCPINRFSDRVMWAWSA
jgi:hypothetical protein